MAHFAGIDKFSRIFGCTGLFLHQVHQFLIQSLFANQFPIKTSAKYYVRNYHIEQFRTLSNR